MPNSQSRYNYSSNGNRQISQTSLEVLQAEEGSTGSSLVAYSTAAASNDTPTTGNGNTRYSKWITATVESVAVNSGSSSSTGTSTRG